jgi:integrase
MASYRKLPSGLWRAEVFKLGVRDSSSFQTKAAAVAWATETEAEILARKRGQVVRKTLRFALERYAREVSPTKANERREKTRILYFCSDEFGLPFVDKAVEDVTPDDLGRWRDARLKAVTGATIDRDMNLLSAVFTTCVREWGYARSNPMSGTRRPPPAKPRDRLITWREIRAVLRALGWSMSEPVTLQQEAGFAFLMALHTGMRASEVLRAEYRPLVAYLSTTKNGDERIVPLSRRAQRLARWCPNFTVSSASLVTLFRRARDRAGVSGFTFHDSRATALTRMSKRVDVMTLAKISGHRDVNLLLSTYYRDSPESIGSRLR